VVGGVMMEGTIRSAASSTRLTTATTTLTKGNHQQPQAMPREKMITKLQDLLKKFNPLILTIDSYCHEVLGPNTDGKVKQL